ncbi:helix-turn-helix domain-containing protein [Actinomadura sp. GTD37]|uniref:helix-turn-helix domain-containing protein n=1 Tax=Actinomadura sp. GTD37 TaxID=1778030 RepID=UPI0035BEEBE1
MPGEPPPDVRTVRLGLELRHIRLEQNLTLQKAHELLRRSVSSISRIEKGQVKLPERDLPPILDAYGITDPTRRAALLALTRASSKHAWWQNYGKDMAALKDVISLENETTSIRTFESLFIPGLLQTSHYAAALFAANATRLPSHRIQRATKIRMRRQEILHRPDPPAFNAIMLEGALRQMVGGPAVMAEQLHHLATMAELAHIDLRILPFSAGAHPAGSSFTVVFAPTLGGDIVHTDQASGGLFADDARIVQRYIVEFEALRSIALDGDATAALIRRLAADLQPPLKEGRP